VLRIAALIDWQNAYKSAREAFGWRDWPNEYGNFSPYAFGQVVASASGRAEEAELTRVFVYRGLPSNQHDPDDRFQSRLRPRPEVRHHALDESVFTQIERRVNYAHHR